MPVGDSGKEIAKYLFSKDIDIIYDEYPVETRKFEPIRAIAVEARPRSIVHEIERQRQPEVLIVGDVPDHVKKILDGHGIRYDIRNDISDAEVDLYKKWAKDLPYVDEDDRITDITETRDGSYVTVRHDTRLTGNRKQRRAAMAKARKKQ